MHESISAQDHLTISLSVLVALQPVGGQENQQQEESHAFSSGGQLGLLSKAAADAKKKLDDLEEDQRVLERLEEVFSLQGAPKLLLDGVLADIQVSNPGKLDVWQGTVLSSCAMLLMTRNTTTDMPSILRGQKPVHCCKRKHGLPSLLTTCPDSLRWAALLQDAANVFMRDLFPDWELRLKQIRKHGAETISRTVVRTDDGVELQRRLSGGETRRINLALLLAFNHHMRKKGRFQCDLLVLDEARNPLFRPLTWSQDMLTHLDTCGAHAHVTA